MSLLNLKELAVSVLLVIFIHFLHVWLAYIIYMLEVIEESQDKKIQKTRGTTKHMYGFCCYVKAILMKRSSTSSLEKKGLS